MAQAQPQVGGLRSAMNSGGRIGAGGSSGRLAAANVGGRMGIGGRGNERGPCLLAFQVRY